MASFNWVDYLFIAVFFFSTMSGLMRGLVKELLAILTWIAAFAIATLFSSRLAEIFTGSSHGQTAITGTSSAIGMDTSGGISLLSLGISFVCIFFLTLIVGALINRIVSGSVDTIGLGGVNRFFGGIFGFIRGGLVSLVIIFLIQLTSFGDQEGWKNSRIIPYFQPAVIKLQNWVYPGFEELKKQIEAKMQSMGHMFSTRA